MDSYLDAVHGFKILYDDATVRDTCLTSVKSIDYVLIIKISEIMMISEMLVILSVNGVLTEFMRRCCNVHYVGQ